MFIALDILLDKLAAESVIDVYETVSRLRETRVNMVQSGEQYVTLYEVIALAIRKRSASRLVICSLVRRASMQLVATYLPKSHQEAINLRKQRS